MEYDSYGVSKSLFVSGIIIAILFSTITSVIIASIFISGEIGPQGVQGEIGSIGPVGGFGKPDYDSGWTNLPMDEWILFDHNLDTTDDIFVYIIGRYYAEGGTWIVNQDPYSITWTTYDSNTIIVYRLEDDYYYDQARVIIWKLQSNINTFNSA